MLQTTERKEVMSVYQLLDESPHYNNLEIAKRAMKAIKTRL